MKRRSFLTGAGLLATSAVLPSELLAIDLFPNFARAGLSILQGLTTETTTQLSVDIPKAISASYTLKDTETGRVINPSSARSVSMPSSKVRVDKLKFEGLELGHKYHFVIKNKANGAVLDDRFLKTVDLQKANAKFAICSCMNDLLFSFPAIWETAESVNVDYFFFIGDNVYGDLAILHGPSFLWSRYVEARRSIPFYGWKNLKPVIAVWDDHDYGKNDANGTYVHKAESKKIFEAFFAQSSQDDVLVRGPGTSSIFKAFGQTFLFFDNRFFRGLSRGGFFGDEQLNFMFSKMRTANSTPTWIIQGAPMFGRTQKQTSYQSHAPQELDRFLKEVKGWNSPVVFAGGDLHYSEISNIDKSVLGYKTHELISSCMHSTLKDTYYDNPNEQTAGYLKENFLMLETSEGTPSWKVTCAAPNKRAAFRSNISIG